MRYDKKSTQKLLQDGQGLKTGVCPNRSQRKWEVDRQAGGADEAWRRLVGWGCT